MNDENKDLEILNNLSYGSLGKTIIIYDHCGVKCVRSYPSHMTNPKTPGQQAHRAHFKATTLALRPFITAIRSGYKNITSGSPWSAAVKHHYPLTYEQNEGANDWTLNFADIALSNGTTPLNISLTASTNGNIQGDWDTPSADNYIYENGKLIIALFNETKNKADFLQVNFNDGNINTVLPKAAGDITDSLHLYYFATSTTLSSATTYMKISGQQCP